MQYCVKDSGVLLSQHQIYSKLKRSAATLSMAKQGRLLLKHDSASVQAAAVQISLPCSATRGWKAHLINALEPFRVCLLMLALFFV